MLCIPSNIMNSLFFPYDIYANLVGFHTLVHVIQVVIPSRKGMFMQILLKSATRFMRYADKYFFCLKFSSLSAEVTLKIRSMSPVLQYIHANQVKICQQVHKILCIQTTFGINLAS